MSVWKVLLAAALVLPPSAYVAGAVAGPPQETVRRPALEVTVPSPSVPSPTAGPTSRPTEPPEDCDDDADEVVIPCPEGEGVQDDDRDRVDDAKNKGSDDDGSDDDGRDDDGDRDDDDGGRDDDDDGGDGDD